MHHRHLREGFEDSVAAVEDVLARGSVEDWRDLAARIRRDPGGRAARSLRVVLDHVHLYGTTVIWRDFLARLSEEGEAPAGRGRGLHG